MFWQRRYVEENRPLPGIGPGLEVIDLPNKGLLGGVELHVSALHAAAVAGSPDVWVHDCLDRVELIVNGSQVVKSYNGTEILAMNLYDNTFARPVAPRNYNNTTLHEYFYLNLGRFYHDTEYMLDLGRVNDPEIRIVYDFTKTGHNGWTNGQAFTGNPFYTVIPHLLRDSDISPKGYIKTSETYRFISAANRRENMRIPRGPVYCGFYLESRRAGQGHGMNMDYVEVNINNGEKIPFRVSWREFENELKRRYGEFTITEITKPLNGAQYPPPLENSEIWEANYRNSDVIGCSGPAWGGFCTSEAHLISTYGPQAALLLRWLTYKGIYPWNLAKIPFLDSMDERTWIDSHELGDFWVRYEEGAGAGANAIIKLLSDEVVTVYI